MKYVVFLGAALGMMLTVGGCSAVPPQSLPPRDGKCTIEGVGAPLWVCGRETVTGYVTAVGSAPSGSLGEQFARREAAANARERLAGKVRQMLQRRQEMPVGQSGTEKADRETGKKAAGRTVGGLVAGAEEMKEWFSPSGELYLLVGLRNDAITEWKPGGAE